MIFLTFKFLFIFIVSTSAIEYKRKTLNVWYEDVNKSMSEIRNGHQFFQFKRHINHECIETNINFNKHRNKELNFAEAMILIYGSGLKCLGSVMSDKAKYAMMKALINLYKREIKKDEHECFKFKLTEISPNYSHASVNRNIKFNTTVCEEIVDMVGFENYIDELERTYGNISALTGEKDGREKFKIYLLTFAVLAGEKTNKRNFAQNDLKIKLDFFLNKAFKTILENIEYNYYNF